MSETRKSARHFGICLILVRGAWVKAISVNVKSNKETNKPAGASSQSFSPKSSRNKRENMPIVTTDSEGEKAHTP